MFVAQISFHHDPNSQPDQALDAIDRLLSALRMNGQVLGREFPLTADPDGYHGVLMLPTADSLGRGYAGQWVVRAYEQLSQAGLLEPIVRILGESPDALPACSCPARTWLILYTTYVSLESCLHCGTCFRPVPLYSVPPTDHGEYHDVMVWQSDYQACDQLQMNCRTGERFALRQMSRPDSSLTRQGRAICQKIEASTGLPVFYYLHRYHGRSLRVELERPCPSCGGPWRLESSLHDLFDFRCTACRLLSVIPATARHRG